MRCPVCDKRLKITHSFTAGGLGRTATALCPDCKKTFTVVSVIVNEEPDHGKGAAAMAKRLEEACKNGKRVVDLE